MVNCLGFEFNAKKYQLLQQMIDSKLLKKDLIMVKSNDKKIHLLGGLNIGKDLEISWSSEARDLTHFRLIGLRGDFLQLQSIESDQSPFWAPLSDAKRITLIN